MSITIDFKGRVATITGAAQGIGFATAQAFAKAGASVVMADIQDSVADSAEQIRAAGGQAVHTITDVGDSESCQRMVQTALDTYGRLDFAFNNAGVGGYMQAVNEIADVDWDRVIRVNLTGAFNCVRHQVPAMISSGGGVIVNNSSILGTRALPDSSVQYTAAKHGVIGLTRQVAVNHGPDGIRCLAICPGLIETALISPDGEAGVRDGGIPDELRQWIIRRTPSGRIGSPHDIAGVVALMCADESAYVTGTHLLVDGGLTHS